MQEMNNSVETSELIETFDGMELIEVTLLANVSGAAPDKEPGTRCSRQSN
jgi:hypothetical protein